MSNSSPEPAQPSESFGESTPIWKIVLFAVVLVAVSGPWSRAGVALLAGIALALYGLSSFATEQDRVEMAHSSMRGRAWSST